MRNLENSTCEKRREGGKEVENKEGEMKEKGKTKRRGGRGRLYIGEREGV